MAGTFGVAATASDAGADLVDVLGLACGLLYTC